ncbi:hypothetical protein TWF694_000787 [Orbilia ellipsospora]|uniref:Uncharacterized protein n=1 Tax=Orbilia ellipsospora TaxID=2528407 RepID=A0AAV9XR43_9PEZI
MYVFLNGLFAQVCPGEEDYSSVDLPIGHHDGPRAPCLPWSKNIRINGGVGWLFREDEIKVS